MCLPVFETMIFESSIKGSRTGTTLLYHSIRPQDAPLITTELFMINKTRITKHKIIVHI